MSRDAGALWRGHRASITTTLAVAVAGLLASCAPDDRILLEDCDVGLYWADCGGNGEPLLACERDTGDCRWFSGGVTARGHAVSDCPTTDPCCHDFWPFTDFGPGGDLLNRVRDQMAIHVLGPVTRESSVEVVFDLTCGDPPSPGCPRNAFVARSGSSVVATFGGGPIRWELEVVTGASWGMHLYRIAEGTRDAPPVLGCYHYSHGRRPVVEGVLHLSTDATDDLEAFHGRFEGTVDGVATTREF